MTRTLRRLGVGVLVMGFMLLWTGLANAQVLKYVRDDAMVVFKLNNPQAVSQKLGAMAQKMGLAQMNPAFGDPLSLLKEQLNLKQGIDFTGEVAVVVFRPPLGEREPRAIALIPVSDYQAFLGNFAGVKKDGQADSFSIMPDGEPVFAEKWGNYAAITPWKDLLNEQPNGLTVKGIVQKQFAEKDLTVYVNMKPIREMALPQVQQIRQMLANMPMGENMPAFQQAMAIQVFDGVEAFLTQTQATALSMNVTPGGFGYTLAVDFAPDSDLGKLVAGMKSTNQPLVTGLPQGKYLLTGGWVQSGTGMWDLVKAIYEKPLQAVKLNEADAKAVADTLDATRKMLLAIESGSFGLMAPEGGNVMETGVIRGAFVMRGDAKAMVEAQQQSWKGQDAFMKATGNEGIDVKTSMQLKAKTVDGVAFDQYSMTFTADPKTPQAAMAAQFIQVLYGKGITSYAGAVNDKTLVGTIGLSDQQMQETVAAVKQQAVPGDAEAIKAASEQLPASRAAVMYVSVGNILSTAFDIASQFGAAVPLKVPEGLPPVGVSLASEGSALRIDASVPAALVENLVSLGIQASMQQQQRRGGRGAP